MDKNTTIWEDVANWFKRKTEGRHLKLKSDFLKHNRTKIVIIIVILIFLSGVVFVLANYQRNLTLLKAAEQFSKEEKYQEAIEKLNFIENNWLVKNLKFKKQEIDDEIEKNKKLLEDKSEYARGIEEFNNGNWERAKELLSKVSADSPYYADANAKLNDAQTNLIEKQIKDGVEKATQAIRTEAARVKKVAEETQKKVEEQIKIESIIKQPSDYSGSLPSTYFSNSVAKIFCWEDTQSDYYFSGSGSIWYGNNRFWIMTNEHVLKGMTQCIAVITKDWSAAADDSQKALRENKILIYRINSNYSYVSAPGYDLAFGFLEVTIDFNQSINLLNSVAMVPDLKNCSQNFPIGTKISIFGYPGIGSSSVITMVEGIISSFEKIDGAYYYLTSAKIEAGDSGGLALTLVAKDIYCTVGVPTFVVTGEMESLGRILVVNESDINYWLSGLSP